MSAGPQSESRRNALRMVGMAAGALAMVKFAPACAGGMAQAVAAASAVPADAGALAALTQRLAAAPRRRSFTRVPFLVDQPDLWDHEAAGELLAYRGNPRQVWENSDIAAAWINLMREAMNGEEFAHHHPDFLAVSATHGNAHVSLFNQSMWDKYPLTELTGGAATRNTFIIEKPGVAPTDDHHDMQGFYGVANNNITTLQRRGAVFVACHDSIHAISRHLAIKSSSDPDVIAADLTNNLIPGAVLVPSVVAFLVELQRVGFTYAKGA
jgi:intracellular sulfur oxidation DsrE/DsrF family protein